MEWHKELSKINPYTSYFFTLRNVHDLHNINIYNMAGEYLRQIKGMTDAEDYFDEHWPVQLKKFDENGMYADPGAPMLYDIATRVQIQLILGNGYCGKYYRILDELLEKGGLSTLKLQSAAFEFPFGGRSNQYLFNEALICANCEYEAVRYKKRGDLLTAGAFKRSATLAARSISRWLDEGKHIKNLYPSHKIGTEGYGYYEKYMITLGSFIYGGVLFADDDIEGKPCPAEVGGYVFETSKEFHKIFANCGGYSVEIDTLADFHYDSTGLGRIHKKGMPTELALSMPLTATPVYMLPKEEAVKNLSACVGWGDEVPVFLSACGRSLESKLTVLRETPEEVSFSVTYNGGVIQGCNGVVESYTLTGDGIVIRAELVNPKCNEIYYQIPILHTNGRDQTNVSISQDEICVTLNEYYYIIKTDGSIEVSQEAYGNRNGEYRVAQISKQGSQVMVRLKMGLVSCDKSRVETL